jgi:hypothetical protein
MNPKKMAEYMLARLLTAIAKGVRAAPLILSGPPGTAKTATPRLAFALLQAYLKKKYKGKKEAFFEVLDMASLMPEDFTGLPHPTDDGTTAYYPMQRLAKFTGDAWGILVCDDASAAQQATQIVMFGLLSPDACVGGHQISPNVLIVVTGNRREDKAGAFNLPSPIINRCEVRTDLTCDLQAWTDWAMENGVPKIIPAFLQYKPKLLVMLPAETNDAAGRFPTLRAWTNLGYALEAAKKSDTLRATAVGFVGEGPGIEFHAFHELREQIDPKAILAGSPVPEGVREDPAKAFSLATALAEEAAVADDREDACVKLLTILGETLGTEYGAGGIRHYLQIDSDSPTVISKVSWSNKLKKGSPGEHLYEAVCESVLE